MIIHDIDGFTLHLTDTTLSQDQETLSYRPGPYRLKLVDLLDATGKTVSEVPIKLYRKSHPWGFVKNVRVKVQPASVSPYAGVYRYNETHRIGCHYFYTKTFKQIIKAARAARKAKAKK